MAIAKIKKIQLISLDKHRGKILEVLQNSGSIEITEPKKNSPLERNPHKLIHELEKIELTYANLDFAIRILSPYGKSRGMFEDPVTLSTKEVETKVKDFDYKKIIEQCTEIEEKQTQAINKITAIKNELEVFSPWENLNIPLENLSGTVTTQIILGSIKTSIFEDFPTKLHKLSELISLEVVNKTTTECYLTIIFEKELTKEIKQLLSEYKFIETDLPEEKGLIKDYFKKLEDESADNKSILDKNKKELKTLAKNLEDLQIASDYFGWEREKLLTEKNLENTQYSFVINAWIPEKNLEQLEESLSQTTKDFMINEVEPEEGEQPPVVIQNNKFMQPFESVSSIYGLPKYSEIDPTPFLAAYFIIFFALCLTDAGYGLLMFIVMALALKFLKLGAGIKKLVKLLMYGGIITFLIGALFGGWFGLTPDQVPAALTYTAANGEKLFIFQKINALTSPITVLIIALALGFIQVLMGVVMNFVHNFRTGNKAEALQENGTWVLMLLGIGFFILTMTGVLPKTLAPIGKLWVIAGALLIILKSAVQTIVTAWKANKGSSISKIIGAIINGLTGSLKGILNLYDLVGYMSDILSYSRMLALGLATAIIGLAVNIVAGLVLGMPFIGWLLAAIVFVGGHIFNLVLNSLGAFIHSGRLQFVEFFTKFMEGGGDDFKPFSKKSKYISIKSSN